MYVLTCRWYLGDCDESTVMGVSNNIEKLKAHIAYDAMNDSQIPTDVKPECKQKNEFRIGSFCVYDESYRWDDDDAGSLWVVYEIFNAQTIR